MRNFTILLILLAVTAVTFAQEPAKPTAAQSDAKKAFAQLKAQTGSWQGTIMGISINFTIRPASSGTAILHEGMTEGGGSPNHEITMFYMEGDRLLATHYCDAGNRTNMEGKLTPDGKRLEFSFLELIGSKKGGYLKDLALNLPDADRQVLEFTFIQPDGKAIPLKGEFKRTK